MVRAGSSAKCATSSTAYTHAFVLDADRIVLWRHLEGARKITDLNRPAICDLDIRDVRHIFQHLEILWFSQNFS
jgi:hypothetical protein